MKKVILIFSTFVLLSCGSQAEDEKEESTSREEFLVNLAEKETLSRLKAPSTAAFVDSLNYAFQMTDSLDQPINEYAVYITVDAENSFGAKLRNRYTVVFNGKGGDSLSKENYELKYFWD